MSSPPQNDDLGSHRALTPEESSEGVESADVAVNSIAAFVGSLANGALATIDSSSGFVAGAAAGTIVEQSILRLAEWLGGKTIPEREIRRIGNGMRAAVDEIESRLDRGDVLREDWSIADDTTECRSPSEEILEGVVRTLATSYEEARVPYIGSFYAGAAFDETLETDSAHALLSIADQLSYRQMLMMEVIARGALPRIEKDDPDPKEPTARRLLIWVEIEELSRLGLIGVSSERGVNKLADIWGDGRGGRTTLPNLALSSAGTALLGLLQLSRAPDNEIARLKSDLVESAQVAIK